MARNLQPIDLITHQYNSANTNSGSDADRQTLSMAAASVYGQAYNASRARQQTPVDARAEARAATQDFLNMEFNRE